MMTAETELGQATHTTPSLPDWVTDPNAVLADEIASWRYGRAPDYTQTRKMFEETKTTSHETGSLASIAENLVKNWEIEASFKMNLKDWRTVNPEKYRFAMNGAPAITGQEMLRLGTYNAVIAPNDFYSPDHSDFASSHKTFKRMMPRFAWEVTEVYSGPPKIAFTWRHWGTMKNDYVGFNDKGEKVTAKAHGGPIVIFGLTVALLDESLRIERLDTWFDPLDMFRQIAPKGIVTRVARKAVPGEDLAAALDDTPAPTRTSFSKAFQNGTNESIPRIAVLNNTHTTDKSSSAEMSTSSASSLDAKGLRKLAFDFTGAIGSLKSVLRKKMSAKEPASIVSSADESYTWMKPGASEPADDIIPQNAPQVKITAEELSNSTSAMGACPFIKSAQTAEVADTTLEAGQAEATFATSTQTRSAHEEMDEIRPADHALMNQE